MTLAALSSAVSTSVNPGRSGRRRGSGPAVVVRHASAGRPPLRRGRGASKTHAGPIPLLTARPSEAVYESGSPGIATVAPYRDRRELVDVFTGPAISPPDLRASSLSRPFSVQSAHLSRTHGGTRS